MPTKHSVVRWISILVTTPFLGVLGWYLFEPGYRWTRLVLFGVLGTLAVIGTGGVWYRRKQVTGGSAVGLFVLMVSLAGSLWLFILPVIVVHILGTVVIPTGDQSNSLTT